MRASSICCLAAHPFATARAIGGRFDARDCASRAGRGMTLVELIIVISMLSILAAIVVPMFGSTSDMARTEAMASNAAQIRSMVLHHASTRDVPLSLHGYPATVSGTWFKMGRLPDHAWTSNPLLVEIAGGAAPNIIYPANKVFDPDIVGAFNAWYNPANGRFWVRVPAKSSVAATLQLFNDVNKCRATNLAQTTESF